jgi:hypothetical protein
MSARNPYSREFPEGMITAPHGQYVYVGPDGAVVNNRDAAQQAFQKQFPTDKAAKSEIPEGLTPFKINRDENLLRRIFGGSIGALDAQPASTTFTNLLTGADLLPSEKIR